MAGNGLSRGCILLIVVAGMERFAFKGVSSNLVTYLTEVVGMSNSSAAKTVNNWIGLTSIMPLLVAPLADFLWDRYSTIILSSFIYVGGLVAVTSSSWKRRWSDESRSNPLINSTLFLFWSLSLISLGQGGYNPSLQAFAADQLGEESYQTDDGVDDDDELPLKKSESYQADDGEDDDDELPLKKSESYQTDDGEDDDDELPLKKCKSKPPNKNHFFSCWYVGICGGSLLGVSLMGYIQDFFGWGIGFAIPTMVMLLSILMLSSGSRFCVYNKKSSDEVKPFNKIVAAAKVGISRIITSSSSAIKQNKDTELQLHKESPNNPHKNLVLENLKVVLRLLPIWSTLLIFAVIFQQPVTFFTKQGMTMNRNILGTKLKIPPATLQSSITVSILILMPLYDNLFIPLTRTITPKNKGLTVTQRMGIGMLLSTLAMIIAALVEQKRSKTSTTVKLSIFWLLPQYILLGVSDIFTVVGMQEFFYTQVPDKMRTTGLALNTSVYGVGSFMSAILIEFIEFFTRSEGHQGWFSDDPRDARIDKYYWLLAVLSASSMAFYALFCTSHNTITTTSQLDAHADDHDYDTCSK